MKWRCGDNVSNLIRSGTAQAINCLVPKRFPRHGSKALLQGAAYEPCRAVYASRTSGISCVADAVCPQRMGRGGTDVTVDCEGRGTLWPKLNLYDTTREITKVQVTFASYERL